MITSKLKRTTVANTENSASKRPKATQPRRSLWDVALDYLANFLLLASALAVILLLAYAFVRLWD
jgi:hypothetical protein